MLTRGLTSALVLSDGNNPSEWGLPFWRHARQHVVLAGIEPAASSVSRKRSNP